MQKLKYTLGVLFALLTFSLLAQLNPQPSAITEKFFPDPDMEINTPGFAMKYGFTEYDDMMPFLKSLAAEHPEVMTISFIGKSQKGYAIPLVSLKRIKETTKPHLRVWLQGGLHGNEPASTEGMLFLIQQVLTNPELDHLLDSIDLAIVPMANIDGMNVQSRYAANGLDLNRDQTKLMVPESILLKEAFNAFGPQVAVDFHEYRAYRRDYARLSSFGVTVPHDVMFLYSGNLNVPKTLRQYTHQRFVKNAGEALDAQDLRHHDYFSSTKVLGSIQFNQGSKNARSSATSYALANVVSSLIEVRGVALGRTSFKRRVNCTYTVARSYLQTAYQNRSEVLEKLAQSRNEQAPATVTSKRRVEPKPVAMIDIDTKDLIKLDGIVRDAWGSSAELSRPRPTAYLLLPSQKKLADKLKVLGLEVEQLASATPVEVEAYRVSEYFQHSYRYEGVYRQELSTELESMMKTFPAGTYVVYLDQEKGNMAIETLEPEAPNSFISFDVLHTEHDALLPYFRYLKNNRL